MRIINTKYLLDSFLREGCSFSQMYVLNSNEQRVRVSCFMKRYSYKFVLYTSITLSYLVLLYTQTVNFLIQKRPAPTLSS